jgi:hypothetical protein
LGCRHNCRISAHLDVDGTSKRITHMGVTVNEISGCVLIEIYNMDGLHGEY